MSINAITSDDTLTLFGAVITDFADGDVSKIDFSDDIGVVKTGKDANTIFTDKQPGNNATLTLRLMRGSSDDQKLNTQLLSQQSNFSGFSLIQGTFVKRIGDGQGNVVNDSHTLANGIFTKLPSVSENVEGATDQAVAVYTIKFATATRGIK